MRLVNRLKSIIMVGILTVVAVCNMNVEKTYCDDVNIQNVYSNMQDDKVTWPKPAKEPNGTSAILMEKDTGAVVYAKEAEKKLYPASITKIMTGLLAVEKLNLSDTVTFTSEMINALPFDAAKQGVVAGETMKVEDCLYSLLLRSNNDMGVALAYAISGSEEEFGKLMTERAKKIGAKNTNFVNSTGLHDDEHYTTAYDMALITKEAMNNPTFAKIWGTSDYRLPATNMSGEKSIWHRHNMLVEGRADYYVYATGGKTGYTDEAGRTLVTSAKNEGMEFIAVVMNTTNEVVFGDTKELFNYGFSNFKKISIRDNESRFGLANSSTSIVDEIYGSDISLFSMGEGEAVIPINEYMSNISYTLDLSATDSYGKVGDVTYTYAGYTIGKASIYVSELYGDGGDITSSLEKVEEKKEKTELKEIFSINIYYVVGATVALLILIFLIRIWVKYVKRRRIGKRYYTKGGRFGR